MFCSFLLLPTANRVTKVMFSVVPVYPRGFPCAGIWSPLCTAPWPCLQPRYIFKLVQLGPHCTGLPDTFKLAHYEIQTVRKRAVGIRLKYLLFTLCIHYKRWPKWNQFIAFVVIWHIYKHYKSCEMRHELTQWKCFVPDTPSFYDHIWIFKHKMTLLHFNVSLVMRHHFIQ